MWKRHIGIDMGEGLRAPMLYLGTPPSGKLQRLTIWKLPKIGRVCVCVCVYKGFIAMID